MNGNPKQRLESSISPASAKKKKPSQVLEEPATQPIFSQKQWEIAPFIALLGLIFALNNYKIQSGDSWWHIEMGRWMVDNASIFTKDIYSKTAEGQPFVAHEWLSAVMFYLMAGTHGIGLSIFKLALMLGGSVLIGATLVRPYWKGTMTLPLLVALAYLMAFRSHMRPQLFGMWCTVALVIGITRWRLRPHLKSLWWLIPVQLFWTNAHGSYLLAPSILLLFSCGMLIQSKWPVLPGDRPNAVPRRSCLVLMLFALGLLATSLINPWGPGLLEKSFAVFFKDQYMKTFIREWYPITQIAWGFWGYIWLSWILMGWWLFYLRRREATIVDLGTLILATVFPLTGTRYLTLSALITFPMMIKFAYQAFPKPINPKIFTGILVPLSLLIVYFGNPYAIDEIKIPGVGFHYPRVPFDIIQHIKAHKLKGVMMNHYDDGAYVIYYLHPEVKTVMDSRTDFYGEELFMEHYNAYSSMNHFQAYLKKYDVNLIMVRIIPEREALRNYLLSSPDWHLEKAGLDAFLFSKADPANPKISVQGIHQRLQQSATNREVSSNPMIDPHTRYCAFVRFLGHCVQAPECLAQCQMTDQELAKTLGLPHPYCLKFSQACFTKNTACAPCRHLCQHYQHASAQINDLGYRYPDVPNCL